MSEGDFLVGSVQMDWEDETAFAEEFVDLKMDDVALMAILEGMDITEKIRMQAVSRQWRQTVRKALEKQETISFYNSESRSASRQNFGDKNSFKCNESLEARVGRDLFALCPNVTTLVFDTLNMMGNRGDSLAMIMEAVKEGCPRLTCFKLRYLKAFDGPSLLMLSQGMAHLTTISLTRCDLEDKCLEVILDNCATLLDFNISFNPKVTGSCFKKLTQPLEVLNICGCNCSDAAIKVLESKVKEHLVSLTIGLIVSDKCLLRICKEFQILMELKCVVDCYPETNTFEKWAPISRLTRRLEVVTLRDRGCKACEGTIDDESLMAIMSSCRRIKELYLRTDTDARAVTDDSLGHLDTHLPHLRVLDVSGLRKLGALFAASVARLMNLSSLRMARIRVTDREVSHIILSCPLLRKVKLSDCKQIGLKTVEAAIKVAAERNSCEQLEVSIRGSYVGFYPMDCPSNLNLTIVG